jgi:signal transduction histidine kinase/ActR/RegA family two-component response regulator
LLEVSLWATTWASGVTHTIRELGFAMRKSLRPAEKPEADLVGREVACGVFTALLESLDEIGLDLADLVAGTGYSLDHYKDPTQRVSWSAFQSMTDRLGELLSDDQLRAIGRKSIGIQHFEPQVILARLLLRPTEAYNFIIRGDAHGDFACLSAETRVDEQIVSIDVNIASGYGHAPVFFSILAGAAEALPTFFGLPPAMVEVDLQDRGATFVIDVPPGGGRWSFIERLRQRFWRTRRIDEVHDRLWQRRWALETSAAQRLAMETDLKEALDEHRRRLANMNDVVVELDDHGRVSFVSPNIGAVLGIDESDFVADAWSYLQPIDHEFSTAWIAKLEPAERWIEVNPSRYGDGHQSELLLVVRDVTERVELGEQLSTSRRLESLGVMATGVAHDFNNLLVPIVGNISSILGQLPDASPLREPARAIETAARLSAQLVDQILATTGRSLPHNETCDVTEVVESMAPLLADMVGPAIDVSFDCAGPAPAMVDRESLGQLLTNLVLNASQAIGADGQIVIRVDQTSPDNVVLSVTDNGSGMTAEESDRMTEPFFTTRPGGRGLGLASLAGLLHTGKARLSVASEIGRGTEVSVVFSTAPPHIDLTSEDRPLSVDSHDARILLVDDDDFVRGTVESLLGAAFATVVSVADSATAVAVAASDGPFDCLVTDLTMPGIRGPELIGQIREVQAGVPVLLITGAGTHAARDELEAAEINDVRVLTKPFTPTQLMEAVQREIGRVITS